MFYLRCIENTIKIIITKEATVAANTTGCLPEWEEETWAAVEEAIDAIGEEALEALDSPEWLSHIRAQSNSSPTTFEFAARIMALSTHTVWNLLKDMQLQLTTLRVNQSVPTPQMNNQMSLVVLWDNLRLSKSTRSLTLTITSFAQSSSNLFSLDQTCSQW